MRVVLAVLALGSMVLAGADEYFSIRVVDAETGRGVPLVELTTTGSVRYYTDSFGLVAFREPGLMGKRVWFHVKSHGYEHPADGFKYRGVALVPKPGNVAVVRIRRINIAERLYRVTGGGIYRDSVLLGEKVPLREPLLNGCVMGQDSVLAVPYRGKLFWIWGDTNRVAYPLGNFGASGARSDPPGAGGLDPSVGVDLTYFVDARGFSKVMCPIPGPGPKWLGGLMVLDDRMIAMYMRVKRLGVLYERGIAVFNDKQQIFEKLVEFDLKEKLFPHGHPVRVGGHFYFGNPFHNVRVKADLAAIRDPRAYEAYARTADGSSAWTRGAEPTADLGKHLRDIETGKPVKHHAGSVAWNDYRQRWIAIFGQSRGTSSFLGEIWYAEADTITGPWVYARKIVTHFKQSFYNPKHHPFFDQDDGRRIYFEGTYTNMFSGNPHRSPRYNYNQIMYHLDLTDERLHLPVPVYRYRDARDAVRHGCRAQVEADQAWDRVESVPFFALDRPKKGLVTMDGFYALPRNAKAPGTTPHAQARVWSVPGTLTRHAKPLR